MEKDKHKTIVIFRKFKKTKEDLNEDVIAFFPDVKENNYMIESYMHIGQHGSADYKGLLSNTVLCSKEEYQDLYNELSNHCGYNLEVRSKFHQSY